MSSKFDSIISNPNDEEFGPFGRAAVTMLEMLFPGMYQTIVVANPTFSDGQRANIAPQFDRGEFCAISFIEQPDKSGNFVNNLSRFEASSNVEELLNRYRYEHTVFANDDLSILTAWAQAEYAVVAFKKGVIDEYGEWIEAMNVIGVLRKTV